MEGSNEQGIPGDPGMRNVTGLGKVRSGLFGSNPMNLTLGIIAIIVLAGSFSVLMYNELSEEDTDTITVNDTEYTWDELFEDFEMTTLDENDGILLNEIVEDTGLEAPETHEYVIKAADGYQKTVTWDDMQNGIVKENKETYFSELPKQFFVQDVVEIEIV
jgi:hypothetical protein